MQDVTFSFEGKRFVVTGASSGIGRRIAEDLAKAGGIVLAIARRQERLKELQVSYPRNVVIGVVDVRDYKAVDCQIREFVSACGKIHGMIHAAGVTTATPLRAYNEDEARAIMDISFWAGCHLVRIVNQQKHSEKGCSNVLFSSVTAHTCEKAMFAYSAAKAALQVAACTFSKEIYRNGNRINTISPGWINSEMTQGEAEVVSGQVLGRHVLGLGKPQDISAMVLFLLSDAARWITGTDFILDGGYCTGDTISQCTTWMDEVKNL